MCVGQSQRGKAPPDPTEKKLLTHHQVAHKRKRSARLAGEARKQLQKKQPGEPTTNDDRRPQRRSYRRECDKWLGFRGAATMHVPFSPCLNQKCMMRSTE